MILVNVRCGRCHRVLQSITRQTKPTITADGQELMSVPRCKCDLRSPEAAPPSWGRVVSLPWVEVQALMARAEKYGKTQSVSFNVDDRGLIT